VGGGRVLFVRNDNLYSEKLSLKERKLEGDPELIQSGVACAAGYALADFSVSRSGLIAWRSGTTALSQVRVFDRQGKQVGTFGPPNDFNYLRLSPDETHLLGSSDDGGPQLMERDRSGMYGLGAIAWSIWSPDGSRLLGPRGSQIVERSVSSSNEVRVLAEAPDINYLEDISPDGRTALFSSYARSVFSIRLDGTDGNRAIPVVKTGEEILNARFSPDGRWIVYEARRVGIFVQPFPGPGLRRQVASTGSYPIWHKDGKEIVFLDTKSISAISVSDVGGELRFGSPKPLFEVPLFMGFLAASNSMAVTRDGSRILFPQALAQPEDSNVIHVRSGWLETQP
jgi:hypothetical protein